MLRSVVITLLLISVTPGCAQAENRRAPLTKYATSSRDRSGTAAPIAVEGAAGNVALPRFPSISPDGQTVVFSWRGDLWKVNTGGGMASRLTSPPSDE